MSDFVQFTMNGSFGHLPLGWSRRFDGTPELRNRLGRVIPRIDRSRLNQRDNIRTLVRR